MPESIPATDPFDLVTRGATARVYSPTFGKVTAEGRVVGYHSHPSLVIQGPDGRRSTWPAHWPREEIDPLPEVEPDPLPDMSADPAPSELAELVEWIQQVTKESRTARHPEYRRALLVRKLLEQRLALHCQVAKLLYLIDKKSDPTREDVERVRKALAVHRFDPGCDDGCDDDSECARALILAMHGEKTEEGSDRA